MKKFFSFSVGLFFSLHVLGMSFIMGGGIDNFISHNTKKTVCSCHHMEMNGPITKTTPASPTPQKMICCDQQTILSSAVISISAPKKINNTPKKDSDFQKFLEKLSISSDGNYYLLLRDRDHISVKITQNFLENIFQKRKISGFLAHKKITVLLV